MLSISIIHYRRINFVFEKRNRHASTHTKEGYLVSSRVELFMYPGNHTDQNVNSKFTFFKELTLQNLTLSSQMNFVKSEIELRHKDCSWCVIIVATQL